MNMSLGKLRELVMDREARRAAVLGVLKTEKHTNDFTCKRNLQAEPVTDVAQARRRCVRRGVMGSLTPGPAHPRWGDGVPHAWPRPPSLTPTEDQPESRAATRACPSLGSKVC